VVVNNPRTSSSTREMPSCIAFFPWVHVEEPLTVGSVRLIPYGRGHLPGDSAEVSQADIDNVLSAYALRKDELVEKAALLEVRRWRLGKDASRHQQAFFDARELIAFSALARRRLFGMGEYCNFDSYALTIQRYQPGSAEAFSFQTRRRDGFTNQLWDTEAFTFVKPLHVEFNARLRIDETLLKALLKACRHDSHLFNAIVEFNRANTDSPDVPTHTEVVMTKSAFEFLFRIDERKEEFVRALNTMVPRAGRQPWPKGPLARKWKARFPRAAHPLEAWAREFCDLRGGAAHGQRRGGKRFVWSETVHLAFASILFPLLVKRVLAQNRLLTLDERDEIHLESVDAYIVHNPFARRRKRRPSSEHPWSLVYNDKVLGELLARGLRRRIDSIDWAKTAGTNSRQST
jgi:hypothetical protein